MTKTWKQTVKPLVYGILNPVAGLFSNGRAVILLYHAVGVRDTYLSVGSKSFARQMAYLKNQRYNVVQLRELYQLLLRTVPPPPRTVVLTFDDGYRSHLQNVLPVLKEYNFPATFFVPTGFLGRTLNNSENRPLAVMSQQELKKLGASDLADIQPHSVSHRELTGLPSDEIRQEIEQSKQQVEKLFGKEAYAFAYPRGKINAEAVQAVRESGLKMGLTVEEGMVSVQSNPYLLQRNTINRQTGLAEFRGKLSLASRWLSRLNSVI